MDMKMTVEEREAFLAGLHVGVMAVERSDGPPLSVRVWYDYEPGGDVVVVMGADSLKQRLLTVAGRSSLCAQNETLPYKYVSVEGEVSSPADADVDDTRSLAHRYMGEELGDMYADATAGDPSRPVTARPQRWFTVDYSKIG
jgi:hypothetical protein